MKDYEMKKRKGGKMDYRWLGPYIIEKSHGKGLYALKVANNSGKVLQSPWHTPEAIFITYAC